MRSTRLDFLQEPLGKAYLAHVDSASGRNGRIARAMGDGGFALQVLQMLLQVSQGPLQALQALQVLQVSVLKTGRIDGAMGDGGWGSAAGRRLRCICGRKFVEPYVRRDLRK